MTFQAWKLKYLYSMTFQVFHDLYEPWVFLEATMTFFDYHNFLNSSKLMSTGTRMQIFRGKEVKPIEI